MEINTVLGSGSICLECREILQRLSLANINNPLREYGHTFVCLCCGSSLRSIRSQNVPQNCPQRNILLQWVPPHQTVNLNQVCMRCWLRATRTISRHQIQDQNRQDMNFPGNEELQIVAADIPMQFRVISSVYKRVSTTESQCIFSNCRNHERRRVPRLIRKQLLSDFKIYVPENARICSSHLSAHDWLHLANSTNHHDFTGEQMDDMMSTATYLLETPLNFHNTSEMNPDLCRYWVGLSPNQFTNLHTHVPSISSIELFAYMAKLRTGESNRRLSSLLNISCRTLHRHLTNARSSLSSLFLPRYLGLEHISVQDVARRNKLIPNGLFGKLELPLNERPAIVICDGTYVYVQKSSNYAFQKKTYSLHKFQNLVKPFLITCCDGYILEVLGPYAATESDSSIMNRLFHSENGVMRQFFRRHDVFILDRGFRDSISHLESHGYSAHMPESLMEGHQQLTTHQANKSRCITMCRWVVEVVNGRFKRDFKIFRQEFFNLATPHLIVDFKIAAAILNKFHPLIEDVDDAAELLQIALGRLNTHNHLGDFVVENNLNRRRAAFQNISGHIPNLSNFPSLSLHELRKISLGNYQIKQARSYCGEHLKQNGSYHIDVCSNTNRITTGHASLDGNNLLLKGRIKSRHITSKVYYTYILLNNDNEEGINCIKAHYCSCLVGMRTVGCCAHVMSILWYLGYARHQTNIEIPPALFLENVLIDDNDEEEF